MREVDVPVPGWMEWGKAAGAVERCVRESGLRVTRRGTLVSYLGSIHWHLKRDAEHGTLEVTVWPGGGRAWCSVQAGRTATWVQATINSFAKQLGREFQDRRGG